MRSAGPSRQQVGRPVQVVGRNHSPIISRLPCSAGPDVPMVYDFPAPDWPYASMETLYPWTKAFVLSVRYSQTPSCVTSSPKTLSNTKSLRPCGESTAKLVGDVTCTIERRNLCGMRSNPGSVDLRGGRTRTAVRKERVSRGQMRGADSAVHTNFDGRLAILIGRSTSSAGFARHTHATVRARRSNNPAHGPRAQTGRTGRRACHGSSGSVAATKCGDVVRGAGGAGSFGCVVKETALNVRRCAAIDRREKGVL